MEFIAKKKQSVSPLGNGDHDDSSDAESIRSVSQSIFATIFGELHTMQKVSETL